MKNPFHRHKWHVVAFDAGYLTTYTEGGKSNHQLTFEKCRCGKRRMVYHDSGYALDAARRHDKITKAKHCWVETGRLRISNEAEVYDPDYEMVSDPNHSVRYWDYKPITEVGLILKKLKTNEEFQEMLQHKMIADAFGELETVIKMHEKL